MASEMSPMTFITSKDSIESIQRKLILPHISKRQARQLLLDPSPRSSDLTIVEYHKWTSDMLPIDRSKLHVTIPFTNTLEEIKSNIASLNNKLTALQSENESNIAAIQSQNESNIAAIQSQNESNIAALQSQNETNIAALQSQNETNIAALQSQLEKDRKIRITLFIGNTLIDMARSILKDNKMMISDPSTNRLQQLAANMTIKQFKESNIPSKYWTYIRSLPEIIENRNSTAHESSLKFAQLLLSDYKDTDLYYLWKDAFPLLYNGSVEEVAARGEKVDRMLFG